MVDLDDRLGVSVLASTDGYPWPLKVSNFGHDGEKFGEEGGGSGLDVDCRTTCSTCFIEDGEIF